MAQAITDTIKNAKETCRETKTIFMSEAVQKVNYYTPINGQSANV